MRLEAMAGGDDGLAEIEMAPGRDSSWQGLKNDKAEVRFTKEHKGSIEAFAVV